jgi:hypothetical protein
VLQQQAELWFGGAGIKSVLIKGESPIKPALTTCHYSDRMALEEAIRFLF